MSIPKEKSRVTNKCAHLGAICARARGGKQIHVPRPTKVSLFDEDSQWFPSRTDGSWVLVARLNPFEESKAGSTREELPSAP